MNVSPREHTAMDAGVVARRFVEGIHWRVCGDNEPSRAIIEC